MEKGLTASDCKSLAGHKLGIQLGHIVDDRINWWPVMKQVN
jgi:hypothetical protein